MTYRIIAFRILLAIALCGTAFLMFVSHQDMAVMRTSRPSFNFNGAIAFLAGMIIAGGLSVLFTAWRLLCFDRLKAARDLKIWIGVLIALLISFNGVFAYSYIIDTLVNDQDMTSFGKAAIATFVSLDGLIIGAILLWPVPAIAGLWAYRRSLAKRDA